MSNQSSTLLQILFLNKDDLFIKKVQSSDIKNFFPVRDLLQVPFRSFYLSDTLRRTLTAHQKIQRPVEITLNAGLAD